MVKYVTDVTLYKCLKYLFLYSVCLHIDLLRRQGSSVAEIHCTKNLMCLLPSPVSSYPGAPWTSDEVAQTKMRLNWIMMNPTKKVISRKLSPGRVELPDAWLPPKAGTFLRLGFHDCLRYTDGTGGCDGCLEWRGVGVRRVNEKDSFSDPDVLLSDNNGLSTVVEVLEELYTNPSYLATQTGVPSDGPSLRERGEVREMKNFFLFFFFLIG